MQITDPQDLGHFNMKQDYGYNFLNIECVDTITATV